MTATDDRLADAYAERRKGDRGGRSAATTSTGSAARAASRRIRVQRAGVAKRSWLCSDTLLWIFVPGSVASAESLRDSRSWQGPAH